MTVNGPESEVRSITLGPNLAEVVRGRALLAEIASRGGFSAERSFDITVACSEAMANAIEHSPVKGEVQVRAILRRDRLEVEVQGPGEFQAPDRLTKGDTRGLGLPLMAKLSDHLALFSGPKGETFVSLTFYRPGVEIADEGALPPTFANLAEENRLLDDVLKNFPDAFFVLDQEWRFVYLNPEALARVDMSLDDLVGRDVWEVFPNFGPKLRSAFEAAMAEGSVKQVIAATPGEEWREWTAFPVEEGLAVWANDITERKRAEEQLRQRSRLLDLSFEAIFAWELDGSIQYWNAGAEAMYGFSPAAAIGAVSHDLLSTDFFFGLASVREALLRDGYWSGELLHTTMDGRTLIVESRMQLLVAEGRSLVLETARDVTERKRADREREHFLSDEQALNDELAAMNEELAASNEELVTQTEELLQSETLLRETEERFRSVLEGSLDGIYRVNLQTERYEYTSPAFGRTLGRSNDEFRRLSPQQAMLLVHPDDLPQTTAALGKAGDGQPTMLEYRTLGADGRYRWVANHFSQVSDSEGRPLYRDGVVRSIDNQKGAEEKLRRNEERGAFLLELADSLRPVADPIDAQETASRLLGERLHADRVTYFEVRGDDYIVDRDYAPTVPHLSGRYPVAVFGERLLATYRAGRVVVSNDIAQDPIPPAERESFFSIQVHAQIAVPLIKNGEFVAGLAVHSATPRTWTPSEIRLVEDTAERTWDAVERARTEKALRESEERHRTLAAENERLYRQQLDIAENLQSGLLNIPSVMGPLRVGHLYRSATEAAKVGGDFYDVFKLKDGKVVLLLGDVSGHGIQAARTATLVKDVVHAFVHQSTRPHEVVKRTNDLLVEKDLPGFVTLWLGILDTENGVLRFVSAGHPEALLRRASGEIQLLGWGSSPLGVFEDAAWRPGIVQLEPEDLLVLYTDGVLEARQNGDFFGLERLEAVLKRERVSVELLPQAVLDQVLDFSRGRLSDDVAVLAVLVGGMLGAEPATSRREPSPGP